LLHALRNRSHTHLHSHADGTIHAHEHTHFGGHLHPHGERAPAEEAAAAGCGAPAATKADLSPSITPWVLFAIFAFGPCEPLIPLLIYPAAKADMWSVACVTSLFALTTLATMTSMVFLVSAGTSVLRFDRLARYSHALAGLVLLSCGLAVKAGL
jgi:sulfite exporter TauE/SafE